MEGDEDSGESESEGDEPNLDWLPDPDKIYGPEGGQKDSGDEASGSSRYGLYPKLLFYFSWF